MNVHDDSTMKVTPETRRRYEMMRREQIEIHLFGTHAVEEKAHCGEDTSANDRMSEGYYMEGRKDGLEVGTVCERCKAMAVPFAMSLTRDLEAEGLLDEAEEYRRLADTLLRETGLDLARARRPAHAPICAPSSRLKGCGVAAPHRSADSLVGEQAVEVEGSRQGHQRHHVPHAGCPRPGTGQTK